MCRLIALILLGIVVAGLVLVVVLFTVLPPGTALFVLFALALASSFALRWVLPYVTRRAAGGFATRLLRAKAAALRDAHAEVHAVEKLARPDHPELDVEAIDHDRDPRTPEIDVLTPHDYYAIELTITPAAPRQGAAEMAYWEPGELLLVPHGQPVNMAAGETDGGWQVDRVELVQGAERLPDQIGKYAGPQRLRLYVSLPHDAPRRMMLQYYTETFGEIELPA